MMEQSGSLLQDWTAWPNTFPRLDVRDSNGNQPPSSSGSWIQTEPKNFTFHIYHGPALLAMEFLASNILITTALLAGLILGLCGLNMTLLELRAATGTPKERRHARAVAKLKKHETWMLCSLIIVSVGFGESFPFLIQSIYPGGKIWISILLSTLLIAVIGEILPQYIIPRRAVTWGYHCRFLVWGCMFVTAIISFPLAWCLDRIAGQKDQLELFTNEELGGMIRHHESAEKHGGALGQDTSRIMLGALKLDGRKIGGEIAAVPMPNNADQDLEKANLIVVEGMIVKWSAVKAVNIDDPVDEAFLAKIQGWSYSRIPVIGSAGKEREGELPDDLEWTQSTQIYGFLHIKSLIGLDLKSETPLLVRDLALYPLPVVMEDMSVYELLNLFQSGMSRMAVVVPGSSLTCTTGAVWTMTEKTRDETISKLEEGQKSHQWSLDYLAAAKAAVDKGTNEKYDSPGIRSPKPIGIVTFEDIIDMILQKTSRDEKDFYDRNSSVPPTKTRKAGDFPVDLVGLVAAHSTPDCELRQVSHASNNPFASARNTLRRRKVTNEKTVCAVDNGHATEKRVEKKVEKAEKKVAKIRQPAPGPMDGAYENSSESRSDDLEIKKTRVECVDSSYTQNSQGGFHRTKSNHSNDNGNGNVLTDEAIAELATAASQASPMRSSYESNTTRSLPSRKCDSRSLSDELKQTFRHVSAAPTLPTLRRITPFSRATASTSAKESDNSKVEMKLVMPAPSKTTAGGSGADHFRASNIGGSGFDVDESMEEFFEDAANQHVQEKSGETLSLNSSDDEQIGEEDMGCLFDAFPVPMTRPPKDASQHTHHSLVPIKEEVEKKKYDGFPMELLDGNKENSATKYNSSTMPRFIDSPNLNALENVRTKSPYEREKSFHDDRALLPSQRKSVQDDESISGIRSTSLWF